MRINLFASLVFLINIPVVCAQVFPERNIHPENSKYLYFYKLTYAPDSLNSVRRTELMRLYSAGSFSEFVSNGTFLSDSLADLVAASPAIFERADFGDKLNQILNTNRTKFRFDIYKDFQRNQVQHYERVWTTVYTYQESLPNSKWNLTSDKSIIYGFKCQRATTAFGGRKYEAWFTREIPVPDGPYKFCGLPGLIVKVRDTRNNYEFELVKTVKLVAGRRLDYPKKPAKSTTKQKIWQAKEDLKISMPNMVAAGVSGITDENKLKMRSQAIQDNNSIEIH